MNRTKKMNGNHLYFESLLTAALAAPLLLCTPAIAQSQNMDSQDNMAAQHQDRDDATRKELVDFNRFMETHPEVAEQLRKDPSLVDNRNFVENHPALQTYLADHPAIRQQITERPDAFMRQEQRYDAHDGEITNREVVEFGRFMNSHPEIAEQLRKDPSLVDNREFVENHPALQEYLKEHPDVRAEIKAKPDAFMRREDRYEDRHDMRDRDRHGEMASFGQFLGGHTTIADQISRNPSLVSNQEYMANHPDLQAYLDSHPAAQAELKQNPESFIKSSQQFDNGDRYKNPVVDPKPDPKNIDPKTIDPKPKQ
jgi:hypothetical protein